MCQFFWKNLHLKKVWVIFLTLLTLPFFHFDPEGRHTHSGELGVHQHEAHFHSEIVEVFIHQLNAHPSDPNLDAPLHQSHSSPDHDKDDVNSYNFHKNIPPIKFNFVVKHVCFTVDFESPDPSFSSPLRFESPAFTPLKFPEIHSSRSPPFYLI